MKRQFLYVFKACLNPGKIFHVIITPNWKTSFEPLKPIRLVQTKPPLVSKHVLVREREKKTEKNAL